MHRALRTLHVSHNKASIKTVCILIEKELWPPNNSPNLNAMERRMNLLGYETFIRSPKQFLNLTVALEKILDNFM